MRRLLAAALLLALTLVLQLGMPAAVLAGPVNWIEVSPSDEGRQWWDAGSLRITKRGTLSVLSRFQSAAAAPDAEGGETKAPILGDLYVMEIDCDQELFRDTAVNGLPRWGAEWQPAAGDGLITAVIRESCAAAGLLPSAAALARSPLPNP